MASDDPVVQEELAAAEAETVRLARLITNLLRLASADAPAPPSEPVDLGGSLRARPRSAGGAGRRRRDGAVARVEGDAAVGLGNADDIGTSLDNLIENALLYAPAAAP